jgi:hypothetical protein
VDSFRERRQVHQRVLSTVGRLDILQTSGQLDARMRSVKEVSERVLAGRGRYQEITPERNFSKDLSPLKVKEVTIQGRRYIVCLNEEQRRKDAADRQAIVEHLRDQLQRGLDNLHEVEVLFQRQAFRFT